MHVHALWLNLLHFCLTLFRYPDGIVLGNLLASLLWLPLQWLGIHLRLKGHQVELHARFDELKLLLDACPECGHRRSGQDLLRQHDSP